MIELDEEVFDVASHANATAFVSVVPLDVNSSKFITCHVTLYSVVIFEEMQQVIEVLQAIVLHPKVIH